MKSQIRNKDIAANAAILTDKLDDTAQVKKFVTQQILTDIDAHVDTRDPTVLDDDDDQTGVIGRVFKPGQLWIRSDNATVFACVSNTTGAAVWVPTAVDVELTGHLLFKGTWDPSSGSFPTPIDLKVGWFYVSTGTGTGATAGYVAADWAAWNGTTWDKVDNTSTVISVAGKTGNIVLVVADIPDFDIEVAANIDVTANTLARHSEFHTVDSHSDTSATGTQLNTLVVGPASDADGLHTHAGLLDGTHTSDPNAHHNQTHTIDSHGTTATGANLDTLTSGSDSDALHIHPNLLAATHAVDPSAHHVKYTDLEAQTVADGRISIHTSNTDAHHVKYTDIEAQTIADAQILTHAGNADGHHTESHTINSHDTTATGGNLNTLTNNSDADGLHKHFSLLDAVHSGDPNAHHTQSHNVLSHSDVTTATGIDLDTLTDGSSADLLHTHTDGPTPDSSQITDATATLGPNVDDSLAILRDRIVNKATHLTSFGSKSNVSSGWYLDNAFGVKSNVVGVGMVKAGTLLSVMVVTASSGTCNIDILADATILTTVSLVAQKEVSVIGLFTNFAAGIELKCKVSSGTAAKPYVTVETAWQ